MSLLNFQNKKRNIFLSGHPEQEDSAFQSSQDCTQMMNSQENSQSSSFDLFSQMMSQQQGHSQQNEIAPSHRFYTKYMSKAPLFPRECSQSDKNTLPRRRSYQDLQESNRQRAKDRDDRDLINTFIALVRECADEIKTAADDIKNNVDRGMKGSANKSATLIKKINEDLNEHYNTLLDSIKEKETEQSKIANLEQELASKEARIEVLENQLEVANAAKNEHMIQSIINAYKDQQKISRDHMDKIHKEQQQFTKEQVEVIKKQQQDQIGKSHADISEKQPTKSLEVIPLVHSDKIPFVDGNKRNTLQSCVQQRYLSTANNQAANIHLCNTDRCTEMPKTIPAVQPTQQLQVTSQMAADQAANITTCSERCDSRGLCMNFEYTLPRCSSTSALSLCPVSMTANNVNLPTHTTTSFLPSQLHQQQYCRPDVSTVSQHPIQQLSRPRLLTSNVQSNAILYNMTSPIPDHPAAGQWSKVNRLKPSPVATVAPQVKDESLSTENDAIQSNQETPELQQRSSRQATSSKQVSQSQPRRHSARVKARTNTYPSNNIPTDDIPNTLTGVTRSKRPKIQQQQKKAQRQKLPQRKRAHNKQSTPSYKNRATNMKHENQEEGDIYEFEEDTVVDILPPKRMKTAITMDHLKSSNNPSEHRLQFSLDSGKVKQHQLKSGPTRVLYPEWITQPTQNKKSQKPRSSGQWMIQDSVSTGYCSQDNSQSSDELSQEQGQSSGRIEGTNQTYIPRTTVLSYHRDDDDEESSEDISVPLRSPGTAVYPKRNASGNVKQQLHAVADDFLNTPCLQPVQYDSENSQQISGYTSTPGSTVRRKISRQAERKRRLQAMVNQANASQTLAEISKCISRQRSKLKRSTSLLSIC